MRLRKEEEQNFWRPTIIFLSVLFLTFSQYYHCFTHLSVSKFPNSWVTTKLTLLFFFFFLPFCSWFRWICDRRLHVLLCILSFSLLNGQDLSVALGKKEVDITLVHGSEGVWIFVIFEALGSDYANRPSLLLSLVLINQIGESRTQKGKNQIFFTISWR